MMTLIGSAVLGFLFRAMISAILAELITRPIAKKVARRLRKEYPYSHYFNQHKGRAGKCAICR